MKNAVSSISSSDKAFSGTGRGALSGPHPFLETILDVIPSSVAVYTIEGTLLFCNRTFAETYGAEDGVREGVHFLKAGRRMYYQISRLPAATAQFQTGMRESLRDSYAGKQRIYTPLEQGAELLVAEVIIPFAGPILPSRPESGRESPEEMILSDRSMRSVVETIRRISNFDSTVLITGESGTGKSMLARYIHTSSKRAGAPFVTINCASIPENLIESELFGYVSGAFTGAGQKGKMGLVEAANGGTLFLDEIGVLPYKLQSKFLQLVQEKTYLPVGGVKWRQADVRIISATNLNLGRQVEEGLFREDLYYRLRVIELRMPPLRERKDAIGPLIDHFLAYYNRNYQLDKTISPKAREILMRYSWSGNIRELQYVIERIMVTSPDQHIRAEDIPPLYSADVRQEPEEPEMDFEQSVAAFEKKLLRQAHQKYGSSYRIAQALKISQTKASRLLRKYDIR